MENYFLTNGEKVTVGDVIEKIEEVEDPIFGKVQVRVSIPVNSVTIPTLTKEGILTTRESCESSVVPMELEYYIEKIAKRLNWHPEKVCNYLNHTADVFPAASLSMILREIAIEIDKKYDDHIENSPEIYSISLLNGKITNINKAHIKNYKNFAAFRSIEDAKIACRITKDILKELFGGSK